MEKHDQLDVNDFNNQMLRDLGFGELVEDMNTSTSNTCGSCERKFCICFADTSSEVTITSEDSLKNSRHSASYETETEVEVEQRMEQRMKQKHQQQQQHQGGMHQQHQQQHQQQNLTDHNWEKTSLGCEDWLKEGENDGDAVALRSVKDSFGGGAAPINNNESQSQSEKLPYGRRTYVRPIMLQPASMFDSDLRVFFVRSLEDVRLQPSSETMLRTDIEFHPFMTEVGGKSGQSWAATVAPISMSSPYYSEVLSYCVVKGGSVNLNLCEPKPLNVGMINGSICRDAIIHAGSIIAVVEICPHKY